ncbi:MAG: energy-coupling factor transporter transmembrane protein EcfT [Lachnospiraceae bacterium]|nr:energy-coupling factor transporter transmembrane protein EcfT [Lachnospiraceae bacterium]
MSKSWFKLDPRTKLMMLITIGLIMMSGTNVGMDYALRLVCVTLPFVMLLTIGNYRAMIWYVLIFFGAVLFEGLWLTKINGVLNIIVMTFCGVITRFGPGYVFGWYVVRSTSASEFITSMERMHFPGAITIPMAVMFRYFPTLKEDYSSIHDAMRMREIGESVKNPFVYIEYILVPLMMSTVQIANDLSAASLSKGLGVNRKRTHICQIRMTALDYIVVVVMAVMLVLSFVY